MTPIVDQPPPRPSDPSAVASWDVVIGRAQSQRDRIEGEAPDWDRLIEAMRERDRIGAERYGVRLAPNNGRDALVDALQEALDLCAYLAQHNQERPGDLMAVQLMDGAIWMAKRIVGEIGRRDRTNGGIKA